MLDNKTLISLSEKQNILDKYILSNNNLISDSTIFKKKIVAFIVELGEYANEERSFKYWSKKQPAPRNVQLDEYIDGLHFLMSLGNDLKFEFQNYIFESNLVKSNIDGYLVLIQDLSQFITNPTLKNYNQILNDYLTIAEVSNYSQLDLLNAYQIKNEVNFQRQDQNY